MGEWSESHHLSDLCDSIGIKQLEVHHKWTKKEQNKYLHPLHGYQYKYYPNPD
jgi:hypothetical protein